MSSVKSDNPTADRCSSVAAVVVTHNRLELLQECVSALRGQSRRPDEIVIVNNGSTDGTAEWLAAQPDLTVVTQANLGSSGGQSTGIKTAYARGHDWFWCMDDDTIPHPAALLRMSSTPQFLSDSTGCLSSLVLDHEGRLFDSPYLQPTASAAWALTVLADRCVEVKVATFISLLVHRRAVAAVGLPVKEFFYMRDDWEFTERISAQFRNFCCLDSIVVHKVKPSPDGKRDYHFPAYFWTTKYFYSVRNDVLWTRLRTTIGRRGKVEEIYRQLKDVLKRVIFGRASVSAIVWFLRGLLVAVRIEFPEG
jgi:rhamnopyranosyl-N-acetylglucosaminyl-diphospho-decaprenol beta-1,3/1,4-galactofuranosyltransferase